MKPRFNPTKMAQIMAVTSRIGTLGLPPRVAMKVLKNLDIMKVRKNKRRKV
jgi:hypothetical protein